jgi:hypothetical protein
MNQILPNADVTSSGRDADEGPLRFVRHWLSHDESRPPQFALLWKFITTIASLLILCAAFAALRAI